LAMEEKYSAENELSKGGKKGAGRGGEKVLPSGAREAQEKCPACNRRETERG